MDFSDMEKEFEKQIQEIMKIEDKTREQVVAELDDIKNMDDLLKHANRED